MTTTNSNQAARRLAEQEPRRCFGCGPANSIGLGLWDIVRDGDDVVSAVLRPRAEYEGYPGLLHGGIAATALDEMLVHAARIVRGVWSTTARMETRYRRPVPLTATLPLRAGITSARGRRLQAWATLALPTGEIAVEATGLLIALPEDVAQDLVDRFGPD